MEFVYESLHGEKLESIICHLWKIVINYLHFVHGSLCYVITA